MIKFINSLLPKKYQNNKGFWGSVIGSVIGLGSSLLGAKSAQKAAKKNVPKFAPERPEVTGARGELWKRLQDWGGQEGYGAIAPDWGDIWGQAQKKVQQYYWGSPTDPGLAGKVKASAARRGVSESPAMENALLKMGASEADVTSRMATEQATKKAQFSEQGRQDWLRSLQGLAGQKAQTYFPNVPSMAPFYAGVGQAASQAGGAFDQYRYLTDILKKSESDKGGTSGGINPYVPLNYGNVFGN